MNQLPTWVWICVAALVVIALYSMSLAACGPWDPWETHYGEVARQILERHDPLDLWWQPGQGPDGRAETTFWSKPALPFWLMAASMKLFGIGTGAANEMVQPFWPELALRLPSLVTGLVTAGFAGFVVWRLQSPVDARGQLLRPTPTHARTAGVATALVLSTMPQWAIVTRQALTDMFFVAPVVLAFGAWALATLGPDRELRRRPLGQGKRLKFLKGRSIPWDRAYAGFICTFIVAVAVPILVLHHHSIAEVTRVRVSQFPQRPGVPNLFTLYQVHLTMWFYWGVSALALLWSLRFRHRSQAWLAIMYLAGGVSVMGKGLIGPGLIGFLVLGHMFVSGRLRLIRTSGLGLGFLLFAVACFPWHHAMIIYRGPNFFAELIVVNNLARFSSGEQEQAVGGFGFYIRTLGLAALPWAAVVPAAIWGNVRQAFGRVASPVAGSEGAPVKSGRELRRLALLWFVLSLGLLTYSTTKYYHYLLPCLPPAAVLVGLWLADLIHRPRVTGERRKTALALGMFGFVVLALVLRDVLVQPAWLAHLTTYLYTGMWNNGAPETSSLVYCCLPLAFGLGLWLLRQGRAAAVTMVLSGLLTTGYVLGDYLPKASESWSQRSALRTYYQQRQANEPLLSWWFYYRGETYFTKHRVWVLKEANREALNDYVKELQGKVDNFWVLTTKSHARRLKSALPRGLRDGVREVYTNAHYTLLQVSMQ
ncbi:MAG: ArnT family glycosyltransferase [Nannocystaceae bacterium]